MRVGAARPIAIARRHARRFDRDVSPIAAHRRSSARAGIHLGVGGLAFLVAYVTFQLLYEIGCGPPIVTAIASIPLFARFIASAACAPVAGLLAGALLRDHATFLHRLPALLTLAIALFVFTVVFFS
jgi:hypothetical protein